MKLNIRQRVRLIALSGAVLSFFGLGCILLIGMMTAGEKAAERGRLLGDSAVAFVEDFSGEQTRKLLAAHVSEKARQVEAELNFTRRNVESLADAMSLILSAPDRYRFRSLLDLHTDTVASGVTYLNYSRKLAYVLIRL